jgi:hypothetical protein
MFDGTPVVCQTVSGIWYSPEDAELIAAYPWYINE